MIGVALAPLPSVRAQAPAPAAKVPSGTIVRRIIMKDAQIAEMFRQKMEQMKGSGLFRDTIPGPDPKKPIVIDITFLTSGNYLLMAGSRDWVDANLETVRIMGYLFERPRAHLQLNLRVVQLTGPASQSVIQLADTVRAMVDTQRDEVVRTFSELEDYLLTRLKQRTGDSARVFESARSLFPDLASGLRPLTVPETLLVLMLDRASPAPTASNSPGGVAAIDAAAEAEDALLRLPRKLQLALSDPKADEVALIKGIGPDLATWKQAVTAARDWCQNYANEVDKNKDGHGIDLFRSALEQPQQPVPQWLARRMVRSLELTTRLYPSLVRKHTEDCLREVQRRFDAALETVAKIELAMSKGDEVPPMPARPAAAGKPAPPTVTPSTRAARNLLALKTLSEDLIPAPLAVFESVAVAADNSAPRGEQLIEMMKLYSKERQKLDGLLGAANQNGVGEVNFGQLQALEVSLNLWLRRSAEAMARALEQHFYRRYANELRLLANKELGRGSSRNILSDATLDDVPDVARDILLADSGVNVFVSNSVSLQFAPEATNSVSAQVQASLPAKTSVMDRLQQAQQALGAVNALSKTFGIDGESIVKSLLAGGQAVPVQSGVNLTATPTIGPDASTVSLLLTANQTLQPGSDKVTDRVTNHTINNATITALSYEPMVLSTLASNISYYEKTGGIPIIRKTPILRDIAKDLPLGPLRETKRERGVYQSSIIILEPVVIPTIEDLVRFQGGSRDAVPNPAATLQMLFPK